MSLRYLIATILFRLILGENTFSYKDANNWGKHFRKCNGRLQSPIAMDAKSTVADSPPIKEELKFKDFDKFPTKMTAKNTGHTVEIKAKWSGKPPGITSGPLNGTYVFEKTIFRWAQKRWTEYLNYAPDQKDNFSYDMEMQLYFYKEDLKSFEKAQSEKGGLAVFKLWCDNPAADMQTEAFVADLEKIIHKVQSINSTAPMGPFPLAKLLLLDSASPPFQFYEGSLDYPPCSESATWFMPQILNMISKKLLNGFRKIKLNGGEKSNVRPPQPLNNRPIKMVYANVLLER